LRQLVQQSRKPREIIHAPGKAATAARCASLRLLAGLQPSIHKPGISAFPFAPQLIFPILYLNLTYPLATNGANSTRNAVINARPTRKNTATSKRSPKHDKNLRNLSIINPDYLCSSTAAR